MTSTASRAAQLKLSDDRLRVLRPWQYGWRGVLSALGDFIGPPLIGNKKKIRRQLEKGDSNAAVVLTVDPLLVGVYSEDLDAAAVLHFPPETGAGLDLAPGTRLVAVNFYQSDGGVEGDLRPGPNSTGSWIDFHPEIGDFLSDDTARLAALKSMIPRGHWERCRVLAEDYLKRNPGKARDGRPGYGGMKSIG